MRSRTSVAFSTPPLNSTCVGHARPLGPRRTAPCSARRRLLPQEARHVPRDRRIGRIGQPEFLQAHAALRAPACPCSPPPAESRRPAPARYRSRSSVALIVPPTRPVPLPRIVTGCFLRVRLRLEQLLLGDAAVVPQRLQSAGCRCACPSPPAAAPPRRASARSILSPPSRMCSPTATRSSASSPSLLRHRDQREIGGAAADIDHQDQVAQPARARASPDAARSRRRRRPAALRAA